VTISHALEKISETSSMMDVNTTSTLWGAVARSIMGRLSLLQL